MTPYWEFFGSKLNLNLKVVYRTEVNISLQIVQFLSLPPKNAQKIADEAANSSACIPIGEGENCWRIL